MTTYTRVIYEQDGPRLPSCDWQMTKDCTKHISDGATCFVMVEPKPGWEVACAVCFAADPQDTVQADPPPLDFDSDPEPDYDAYGPDENPSYRAAMIDAGRGHLLR